MSPYLLTLNSSLGLYKPCSTLLSPSIIHSLNYYLDVRVRILFPTSHLGGDGSVASGAASLHGSPLEAEPTAAALQPHILPRPPLSASLTMGPKTALFNQPL